MGRPIKTNKGKRAAELKPYQLAVWNIHVPEGRKRSVDEKAVAQIAGSIREIGLQSPITVRLDENDGYVLVTGLHRLKAHETLGLEYIEGFIVEWDERTARLWEISENLHRADLTVQQRSDWTAEWIRLTEEEHAAKVGQVASLSKRGRGHEGGVRAAARELGIEHREARRALKIADISPEAKEAAHAAGLSNNQSALLRVANASSTDDQVKKVHDILEEKERRQKEYTEMHYQENAFDVGLKLFASALIKLPVERWGEFMAACDDLRLKMQAKVSNE